jgi:hypothetical protein
LITRCLGTAYANNFSYPPAYGTSGGRGVQLACKDKAYQFSDILIRTYMISILVNDRRRTQRQQTLIEVYRPKDDMDKHLFLRELRNIKDMAKLAWLVMGYFNLIYMDQDENNGKLNHQMMTRLSSQPHGGQGNPPNGQGFQMV